ncbi:MAG: ATP-binding protein [Deltaproteobacteria bacterium]|nr:ATP-binding protein [Deltaproteobacteria bacterium]
MYARLLQPPPGQSFFLFGPRGTGKTAWLRQTFADAPSFDLLDAHVHTRLLANPSLLGELVPAAHRGWVVVDEIQRAPELLNEVHRLIETRALRFVLTGSSARKLRRRGVNLLAGRALTRFMHPLVAAELGRDFDLGRALRHGCLPFACTTGEPGDYLASYVSTYLREEVLQEGLTRNLGAFARFLQAASFSQACVLNMAAVARDCGVSAKLVEDYFAIAEDLLMAVRVPVFRRRAKRRLVAHPKFFFFDAGVFQALRPRGPLDAPEEIQGPALETLLLQQLRAYNDYRRLGYTIHYWRAASGAEVDFVLYGERGLVAIEAKRSARVRGVDLAGLCLFRADYPQARAYLLHLGARRWHESGIDVLPFDEALARMNEIL